MSSDQSHPEHAQESAHPMDIAALLRAAADGELSESQCVQLDEYMSQHPEAESQIRFEQALKSCCDRVIDKPRCPQALRDKVTHMAQLSAQSHSHDEEYEQRIAASNEHTRSKSFWTRSPLIGIAAVLMMAVAGTMIWQSGSFSTTKYVPEGLTVQEASYYNRVGNFVINEHQRCCNESAAKAKMVHHNIDDALSYFSSAFNASVDTPEMSIDESSIEFYGAGDCAVPSTWKSGHFRFSAVSSDNQRVQLSLFVAPDPELLPLEEGSTYRFTTEACSDAGVEVFAWISAGIQYLLVSEAHDNLCSQVRDMMHAPKLMSDL